MLQNLDRRKRWVNDMDQNWLFQSGFVYWNGFDLTPNFPVVYVYSNTSFNMWSEIPSWNIAAYMVCLGVEGW